MAALTLHNTKEDKAMMVFVTEFLDDDKTILRVRHDENIKEEDRISEGRITAALGYEDAEAFKAKRDYMDLSSVEMGSYGFVDWDEMTITLTSKADADAFEAL